MRRLIQPFVDLAKRIASPPPVPDTTPELEAVEREIEDLPASVVWSEQFVGQGEYCLGAGGRYATALKPWTRCAKPDQHRHRHDKDRLIFSDCSGFLCRAWGIPRKRDDGTWLNTDEMERLARLHPVAWADRRPGDGVVYGAGRAIGHCGLYVGGDRVIHCSASGRHAVKKEGMGLWVRKGALILRPELAGLVQPAQPR